MKLSPTKRYSRVIEQKISKDMDALKRVLGEHCNGSMDRPGESMGPSGDSELVDEETATGYIVDINGNAHKDLMMFLQNLMGNHGCRWANVESP